MKHIFRAMADSPRPISRERMADHLPIAVGSARWVYRSTTKRALASVTSFANAKGKRAAPNGNKRAVA